MAATTASAAAYSAGIRPAGSRSSRITTSAIAAGSWPAAATAAAAHASIPARSSPSSDHVFSTRVTSSWPRNAAHHARSRRSVPAPHGATARNTVPWASGSASGGVAGSRTSSSTASGITATRSRSTPAATSASASVQLDTQVVQLVQADDPVARHVEFRQGGAPDPQRPVGVGIEQAAGGVLDRGRHPGRLGAHQVGEGLALGGGDGLPVVPHPVVGDQLGALLAQPAHQRAPLRRPPRGVGQRPAPDDGHAVSAAARPVRTPRRSRITPAVRSHVCPVRIAWAARAPTAAAAARSS